jgi:hypothetical protein
VWHLVRPHYHWARRMYVQQICFLPPYTQIFLFFCS